MLDAKHNRLDYGMQLRPPVGYTLDYAVTTTYSLDLEAILLIPVALFFSENLDFDHKDMREDMLESLTNVSNHISIYCQRGKIKVPSTYNYLMAYWEKGINQIQMPKFVQSFHPKVWIIRYTSLKKGLPVKYRFISTSRNLTFSRDWDMAITTDGEVDKDTIFQNSGIIDFLKYLQTQGKSKIPKSFFSELPHVEFDIPAYFNSIHFHPIGIDHISYTNPVIQSAEKMDYRLVMSPFLDDKTVESYRQHSKNLVLMSSEFELSGLNHENIVPGNTFMFSPFIEEAELLDDLSENDTKAYNQNLHAKFYINKKGSQISWFIGSANASDAAIERNVEFLVELKTSSYQLSPQKIKEKLIDDSNNSVALFHPYVGSSKEQLESERKKEQDVRLIIHRLSSIYITGRAELNNNGLNDLSFCIPKCKINAENEFVVKVKPLPEQSKDAVIVDLSCDNNITVFGGYNEIDLSPFLLFEIWFDNSCEKRFVIDMNISLGDDRFRKIFLSIINNRSKFIRYLYFLLAEEAPSEISDIENSAKNNGKSADSIGVFAGSPVYEKLLTVASREPHKLKRVDSLIQKINGEVDESGEMIVSDEFLKMWEVFRNFK